MLLVPTLNPPSARHGRTLRGADFRGISRYITIIIRSIILGDQKRERGLEKGTGVSRRRGAGVGYNGDENCSLRPPPCSLVNLAGFDSNRSILFSIIQGPPFRCWGFRPNPRNLCTFDQRKTTVFHVTISSVVIVSTIYISYA